MLPAFYSHIIASITLAIPQVILAETALSFFGLGLRPPVVSWGVLAPRRAEFRAVATAPWLLVPAVGVVIAVLALNFLAMACVMLPTLMCIDKQSAVLGAFLATG